MAVEIYKICTVCKANKPVSDYYKNKNYRSGYISHCKACHKVYTDKVKQTATYKNYTAMYRKLPTTIQRNRDKDYQKMFGITLADYNAMFQIQNGKCAICTKHQTELRIRLAVDHCHKTNIVRGLLCDRCNRGIGFFDDDLEKLQKAIDYLTNSVQKLKLVSGGG